MRALMLRFDLTAYAQVAAWLTRVQARPNWQASRGECFAAWVKVA